MVSPANAATVVRALAREELDTRFAVAALAIWLKTDVIAAMDWLGA
jgi:hypothetical protein